jgi:predicted N-acetyltransferase YhbS
MSKYSPPEKLNKSHFLKDFDCGNNQLNEYLKKYAFQNQKKNISKTYVTHNNGKVVGYYTLTYGSVEKANLPEAIKRNLPNYPIPVMVLARLAVDKAEKGKGLGKGLLRDAVLKTLLASKIAGIKAIMVKAKDEKAKAFYKKYDFTDSQMDESILFLPVEFLKE